MSVCSVSPSLNFLATVTTFLRWEFGARKGSFGESESVSGVMLSYGSFVVCEKLFYERLPASHFFRLVRVFS